MSAETIRNFIREALLKGREITDDENLLLSGLIDSLGVIKLVLFLEEEFSLTIPPEDVTIINMASVDTINTYIETAKKG